MRHVLRPHLAAAPRAPVALSAAWWMLDGVGAALFALGLAGTLARAPRLDGALFGWLAVLLGGAGVRAVAARAATAAGAERARTLKQFLRGHVFAAALNVRPGAAGALGERLTAVVDEVEALDGWFSRYEPLAAAARVTPWLLLAAVAVASPVSAAVLLGALAAFALVMALAGMAAAETARRQFDALARMSGLFVDRVRALPVILAFQAEAAQEAQVEAAARSVASRTLLVLKAAFVSSAGLEFFAALSVALVAVYAGFNLLGLLPFHAPETLDLGRAMFVLALAPEVYLPLRRLAAAYHDRQSAAAAGERLARLLEAPRLGGGRMRPITAPPEIRFEDAVLRHAEGAEVGPLDFTAEAGRITVLLAPSGGGKTTALSCLVGGAPLSQGEIWVDGQALTAAASFAPAIAWAGQEPVLTPGAIGANIRLGRPDADPAEVERAAAAVGLAPALARRPAGLATLVDERGSGLSGGERRRIGLARASLKAAPILCLDEPTADLDAASERELIAVLRRMAAGRTTLIATHSAAVAALADKVVRL